MLQKQTYKALSTTSWPSSCWVAVWAAGRSVHHSGVDGNVMAVVERENSSLPLYPPIVHHPSRDSIRQPSDCELVLPLTGYCQPAPYYYCCHFLVVSHDAKRVHWNDAKTDMFTKCALRLISSFSQKKLMYMHCVRTHAYRALKTLFSSIHIHCGSVFPSACRAPVPSVIHEPSAWASAVSDVCQIGPHLSPLFIF